MFAPPQFFGPSDSTAEGKGRGEPGNHFLSVMIIKDPFSRGCVLQASLGYTICTYTIAALYCVASKAQKSHTIFILY